jgi:diacylglycerol O-acyltransferase / wax synthase
VRLDTPFMSESDAFSWYMEQDPELRSTIVGVAWLEGLPPWEQFGARMEEATRLAPSFRRHPIEVPGRLSPPRWVTDGDFDLSWHLRRVGAPEPRTEKVVLELARVAAMTGFDRTRPLWEFTLVEGLRGGRAALIMKLHHSLTDGIGGVQLAHLLLDESPTPAFVAGKAEAPAGERFSQSDLVRAALRYRGRRWLAAGSDALHHAPQTTLRVVRHPVAVGAELAETARSVGRMVKPVRCVLSPVVTNRGSGRRLHMVTVELTGLRDAAHRAGGTVNDGFLAGLTGGLRRYHERHGAQLGDLMVTLPISLRTASDPLGGNRITLQRFVVPAGIVDPADRIRVMGERCRSARSERALPLTNAIAATLNLLPSGVIGSMLKHVDFLASDVPGFPRPVYLCGTRVTGYYAFGPTIGAALNATLFSYQAQCCIGVTVDTDAIPDDDVLVECVREGFAEVVSSATATAPTGNGSAPVQTVRKKGTRAGSVRKEAAPC